MAKKDIYQSALDKIKETDKQKKKSSKNAVYTPSQEERSYISDLAEKAIYNVRANESANRPERLNLIAGNINNDLYKPGSSKAMQGYSGALSHEKKKSLDASEFYVLNPDYYGGQTKQYEESELEQQKFIDATKKIADARTGNTSVLDGLDPKSDEYEQYKSLLNLAGYEVFTAQQQNQPKKELLIPDVEIPEDYDFNSLGDDIFSAKYGELKDGTKLTENERLAVKRRVEAVTGIDDFDALSSSEQLNLTLDEDYLSELKLLTSQNRTGEETVQLSEQFRDEDIANDLLTIKDWKEGHVNVSEDAVNRAKNRIYAATGVNVDALPGGIDLGDGISVSSDDYLQYMMDLASDELAAAGQTSKAELWKQDIYDKYSGLADRPDFYEKSQYIEPAENDGWGDVYNLASGVLNEQQMQQARDRLKGNPGDWYSRMAGFDELGFEYMTTGQREKFRYLYNSGDINGAMQYLQDLSWDLNRQRQEKMAAEQEKFADERPVLASAASVAQGIENEVRGVYNLGREAAGFDINEYDTSFDAGLKQNITRSIVGGNIAEATDGVELFGKNIAQMGYNAVMSATDSTVNAFMFGAGASPMMGAGAFNTSYQQKLEDGLSNQDAFIDALIEGGIEMGTEYFSIDALMKDTTSPLGYFLRNLITEPTEEMTGFAVNKIYDEIKYGMDSQVNTRISELVKQGYSEGDARAQATREMLADLFETGFTAFLSGGVAATGGTIRTAVANQTSGQNLQSNNAEKSMLELATTLPLPEDVMKVAKEQLGAVTEGVKTSAAKIGRVFREMMKAVDEQTQAVLESTMTRNVKGMLKANGVDDAEMAGSVTRIIADNGTATTDDYKRVATNDKALALAEGLIATYDSGVQLNEKAARIAEQAAKKAQKKDQTEVADTVTDNDADIEPISEAAELAAADIPTDETVIAQHITEEASEYTDNTDVVAMAYKKGQDPATFSQQFRRAFEFGEEGRNYDVISKSDSLTALTPTQIQVAYKMGRDQRVTRAEQAAKNRKGMVKVGNIDTSAIRDVQHTLNDAQRKSIGAVSKLAKAIGFNVKFIANTTDAEGNFVGKNGSWNKETRTITIDVNAGRLSKDSTNYAVMQTVGHELTHFIKDFADTELFAQYQDFVIGHLSEKMSETDLDNRISEYIERWTKEGATIDRNGALEEIIADASGDALLNMTEADIQQLGRANPTLLQRIGEFIQKWAKNVKTLIEQAYKGQTARTDVADQMLDAVEEMSSKWADLLKNASAKAKATEIRTEIKTLAHNHIDQRTPDTIRGVDSQLFCSETEEAQIGFAAAAQMLLADVDASISGQKFFTGDGVTGQKRMTSDFLASMKDATGWTWDKIRGSLEQFAAMQTSDTLPKNTVTNREMELYLDEILSNGYTTIDGQKVAPWDEYIEAKEQYKGSRGEKAPQSAYQNAINFADYAFADVKYSARESFGDQIDKLRAGTFPRNDHLYVMDTPDVLVKAGLPKLPILMTQKHARSVMKETGKDDVNYHGLTRTGMKNLPEAIANSSVVIRAAGYEDRVIAFTDMKDANGEVVIAPVEIRGHGNWQDVEIDANILLTAYGKKNIKDMIVNAIMNGDVLYVDKKRSYALEKTVGVQFPKNLLREAPDKSIAQDGETVKFSMRVPVERTKDLVAVHNIREDNLRKALDLGGFPMPSIAIAKRDIGHQNFGSISLVFSSDTIDPKANKRNKVYSADAWTPTFPRVEYEVNSKVDTRVYNKLSGLKRAVDPYFADDLSRMMYGVEDQMNRNGGEEGLVQRALDNYGMKAAYLEENGKHVTPVTRTEVQQSAFTEKQIEKYTQIAELVGAENIRKMPMKDIYDQYGDAINEIYPGASNTTIRFRRVIENVYGYLTTKDSAPKMVTVTDPAATRKAIDDAIDSAAYERWVRDLYSGIEAGSGVYNGKEIFTPSGNRRSFASTHYPATVEGIAKAMYDAHGGNVKNISANHDAKSLRAVTSKTFKSIDEMHKNEGRLKARTQEEADALTAALDGRLSALVDNVLATKPKSRDTYESLMAHDQAVAILQDIAAKKYSAATIKAGYAQYGYNISDADAQAFKELLDDVSAMPVNIFEAKPERAVYFDEVKYAIVPDTLDADVRSRLESVVPDVREYVEGDEEQRLALLNAREDLMFQLRDPTQITDREILATIVEAAVRSDDDRKQLNKYRNKIADLNADEAALEKAREDLKQKREEGGKKNRDDIIKLQNNIRTLENRMNRYEGELLKMEAMEPLHSLVIRERKAARKRANDRANERHARNKYIERIHREAATMNTWLTTPTNKAHVPEFLRKPMAEFLDTLNLYSRAVNTPAPKGKDPKNPRSKDLDLLARMKKLYDVIDNLSAYQNGLEENAAEFLTSNGYLDLPPDLLNKFKNLITNMEEWFGDANAITSQQDAVVLMNVSQLKRLSEVVAQLNTSVRKMNRFIENARYTYANEASLDTISDLGRIKEKIMQNKLMQKAMDFFDWKNTTPYYAFKRFGKGGQAIFESLQNGWDKMAFHADELVKFTEKTFKPEEVHAWEREVKTIKLSNGKNVQMSVAQIMDMYNAQKRNQYRGHLTGGGIRIDAIEGKRGKSITQTENFTLTEDDITEICGQLTKRQRDVADALQQHAAKRGAELGNEVSMKRFGYKMFTEENYWPIESDRNNMAAKDSNAQENSLMRLLNMSATKDLSHNANNAVVIRSVFDRYTAHMSDMAKYNAMALPILDMMKWLNYVEKLDAEGNPLDPEKLKMGEYKGTQFTTRSVQKSLESAFGAEARNYVMEFIKNLNGETEGGREDGFINKLTSNYKIAAVGANLRVGLLQITSMPRAAVVINPKYLLSGIAKWNTRKGMSKAATDNVGIAKWKSMGFYDTNISRNMRQMIKHDEKNIDKARDWSMKFAEWGDAWTMGVLYGAVESELVQTMTPGTEEFNRKLNERMREIIYRTQVVDSTMTRSHLMRQKGAISSTMSFMSEPTLAMNMLNDTLFDLRMNSRSTDGTKWNPAASKTMAKVIGVSVLTTGLASAIEALFTAYRDDDEYETFLEKYWEALLGDYSDAESFMDYWQAFWDSSLGSNINPLGSVPIISDMVDAWKTGAATQMWQEFLGDLSSGTAALVRAIRNDGSLADYYGACYKILNGFSRLAGVPVSGAVRELAALYNTIVAEPMGWRRVQTYDNSPGEAADSVLDALIAGDSETAAHYRKRAALYGVTDEDINDALSTRVNDAYLSGRIDRSTADKLLTSEAGKRSRDAEKTLAKSDYTLKTGLKHSEMKEDFITGTISEQQARDYLDEYDGLRDEEIDKKIGEWEYEKETGLVYGNMKADFIDGVLTESQVKNYRMEYGDVGEDAVKTTLGEWKYERDTGLVYDEMKLDYEDGVITEAQARKYLAQYGLKDEEEVEEKISNFDFYVATGRTTSAPKYWRIAHAFDTGADYQSYIDEAFDTIMNGGEKRKSWKQARNQIAGSLASFYKKGYLAVKGTPAGDRMLEHILELYEAIGYTRSYQREYIEENWIEE